MSLGEPDIYIVRYTDPDSSLEYTGFGSSLAPPSTSKGQPRPPGSEILLPRAARGLLISKFSSPPWMDSRSRTYIPPVHRVDRAAKNQCRGRRAKLGMECPRCGPSLWHRYAQSQSGIEQIPLSNDAGHQYGRASALIIGYASGRGRRRERPVLARSSRKNLQRLALTLSEREEISSASIGPIDSEVAGSGHSSPI